MEQLFVTIRNMQKKFSNLSDLVWLFVSTEAISASFSLTVFLRRVEKLKVILIECLLRILSYHRLMLYSFTNSYINVKVC